MNLWMGFWVLLVALAISSSGCSTPKSLNSVSRERFHTVRLEMADTPAPGVLTLTRKRMNEGMVGNGLVGALIATSIASTSGWDELKIFAEIRGSTGAFEAASLANAFQTRIESAGINSGTDSLSESRLIVHPQVIALVELSREKFTPCIVAQARVINADNEKVWQGKAKAIRNSGRPLEDYLKDPQLYKSDFDNLAEDLARQLVSGPIRPMR